MKGGEVKKPETEDEFNKLVSFAGAKTVVIDFFATWCGPCKVIAPAFKAMAEEHPNTLFITVDVDVLGAVSKRFKVEAMPTFKILKGGNEVHSVQGANEAGLRQAVAQFAS
ncbi:thioredoxin [Baffinella frigidus]|nr:thioredoxin [Cryptophyta sp. CCMP2293]